MEQVTINKLDNKGRGIGYYHNKIIFVKNTLPGEEVVLKNTHEYKKYFTAEVERFIKTSDLRNTPKCPYYDVCGGCNLMHVGIDYQEEYKYEKVKDILKKYAHITDNVKFVKNNKELFYRNKITLHVHNGEVGYYNDETHQFVNVNNCLIVNNEINEFIKKNLINVNNGEIVIRVNYEGKILVSVNSEDDVSFNDLDNCNIAGVVINDKCVYGEPYFYDYIGDFKFKVSYNSFFQVNNYINLELFNLIKENIVGKTVLDLYSGVGTLSIVTSKVVDKVYSIEVIPNAVKNALINAKINKCDNINFILGKVEDKIGFINDKIDTIIVDPARAGLDKKTIEVINNICPQRIIYVSCDTQSLANNLVDLANYEIKKFYILDMFSYTYHIECFCILDRKIHT